MRLLRPAEDEDRQEPERVFLERVRPGVYQKTIRLGERGTYRAWIPAPQGSRKPDERLSPITFTAELKDEERSFPLCNHDLLRRIASASGGRHGDLREARSIIASTHGETFSIPRRRHYTSLRDSQHGWVWWMPALFLGLLGAEWLLRKRSRLP